MRLDIANEYLTVFLIDLNIDSQSLAAKAVPTNQNFQLRYDISLALLLPQFTIRQLFCLNI